MEGVAEHEMAKLSGKGEEERKRKKGIVNETTNEVGRARVKKKGSRYKHDKVALSISIHCMDRTEELPLLLHQPVVEIFICDTDEGTLLKKSYKKRKVTSLKEEENVTEILPLMTMPFNIKERRSLFCQWDEELIFNESINYLKEQQARIILLFRLKDSVMSQSNGSEMVWDTFAWAFLKPFPSAGWDNIGKRLKLQLYRSRKLRNVKFTDLFSWWKSGSRRKYNSSLHITTQAITLPAHFDPAKKMSFDHISKPEATGDQLQEHNASLELNRVTAPEWNRKVNDKCKIPNSVTFRLSTLGQGCMVVRFSNDGLKLGCGTNHNVLVYDIINGQLLYYLRGHLGLIYDMDWSQSKYLLSCSADATVRVWKLRRTSSNSYHMEVLVHPSYVYTAKFSPTDHTTIVSGCYDNTVRVWIKSTNKYIISQELNLHLGFITSIIYDLEGEHLYTSDKHGLLSCWKVTSTPRKGSEYLELVDSIKLENIYGVSISHLAFHPNGKHILLHTKDSCIRLMSLKSNFIIQNFQGHLNNKEIMKSCLSPCGSLVFSGSEDGSLYVWDCETGEMRTAMFDLPFEKTISCIDFHPFDDIMAVSSYVEDSTILIMKYDISKAVVMPKAVEPATSQDGEPSKWKLLDKIEMAERTQWKDIGRELLLKLDFILKTSCTEPQLLNEGEKKHRHETYSSGSDV